MSNVFGQAAKQVRGLAKHALGKMVAEPLEVVKNVVGQGDGQENQAMQAVEQGAQGAQQQATGGVTGQPTGFKTQQDFQKYQALSPKKDAMELALLRRRLSSEWGVEAGMEKARAEFAQKEKQREQVEEREVEQKKYFEFEKKKAESAQVAMAKNAASAEKRMSVAG